MDGWIAVLCIFAAGVSFGVIFPLLGVGDTIGAVVCGLGTLVFGAIGWVYLRRSGVP